MTTASMVSTRARWDDVDVRWHDPNLQLDLMTTIARIEQASREPEMLDILWHRLVTCDAPRLRRHLTPESLEGLDRALASEVG